jgi:hypothetical protein
MPSTSGMLGLKSSFRNALVNYQSPSSPPALSPSLPLSSASLPPLPSPPFPSPPPPKNLLREIIPGTQFPRELVHPLLGLDRVGKIFDAPIAVRASPVRSPNGDQGSDTVTAS